MPDVRTRNSEVGARRRCWSTQTRTVERLCQTPMWFRTEFHRMELPGSSDMDPQISAAPFGLESSSVFHAPDGLVAIFTDKQAAVFRDGNSDRATPNFAFWSDEASYEILIFATRVAG
jgi:hypothetical protein